MFLIGIISPTVNVDSATKIKHKKFRPKIEKVSRIKPVEPIHEKQQNFFDEIVERKYQHMRNRINIVQRNGSFDTYI